MESFLLEKVKPNAFAC